MDAQRSRGRKSQPAVAGVRARRRAATTPFGQTCPIEDRRGCARRNGRGTRIGNHRNLDRVEPRSPFTAHIWQFLKLAGRGANRDGKRAARPSRVTRNRKVNPQAASEICSAKRRPVQNQNVVPVEGWQPRSPSGRDIQPEEQRGAGRRAAMQGAAASALIAG